MVAIPTCCVTGRIAGDPYACGDCDPCILGAKDVPEAVRKVIAERDKWADEYAGAMMELEEKRAIQKKYGLPSDLTPDDVKALFSLPDDDDSMHQQPKS